jgi:hypothetical protein
MTRVTIGELKKLIANLPDDYEMDAETPDDNGFFAIYHKPEGAKYMDRYAYLDELEPYETPEQRAARLHHRGQPKRDLANHLDNLFNPPDQK